MEDLPTVRVLVFMIVGLESSLRVIFIPRLIMLRDTMALWRMFPEEKFLVAMFMKLLALIMFPPMAGRVPKPIIVDPGVIAFVVLAKLKIN